MLSSRSFSLHDEYNVSHGKHTVSKTPGRALKGRAGLQENVLLNGAMTTNPAEKRANLKTPFRKENDRIILKDAPASTKPTTLMPNRPLIDKTPAPNRLNTHTLFTPLPNNGKISKSLLPELINEVEANTPVQPPSSTRKKLRVPRSSSSNKAFETPVTAGDHWNVSDISIEEGGSSLDNVVEDAVDEPDYSDPEYMPPKVKELPFTMPFELPDYREVGRFLSASAHSYPVEDPPHFPEPDTDEILKGCGWPLAVQLASSSLDLSDDDIFGPPKKSDTKTRPAGSKNIPTRPLPRPATAIPRAVATRSGSAVRSVPSRPATAASTNSTRRGVAVTRPTTSASTTRRIPPTTSVVRPGMRAVRAKKAATEELVLTFDDKSLDLPGDDFRFAL